MAAITSEHGKQYILLSDLVSGKLTRLPVPRLLGFQWLTEERLLCHSGGTLLGEMFAVNIDGTQTKVLVQPILTQLIASKGFRGHIFEVLGGVPRSESVLVADYLVTPSNLGMYPHPDVQRLNYFTGALALEERTREMWSNGWSIMRESCVLASYGIKTPSNFFTAIRRRSL